MTDYFWGAQVIRLIVITETSGDHTWKLMAIIEPEEILQKGQWSPVRPMVIIEHK